MATPVRTTSRRRVLQSSAWAVPVVSVAVPTPALALSPCAAYTTYSAPQPTNATRVITNWTVPAGVRSVAYAVTGGGGGGTGNAVYYGGPGAVVYGELQVTPGTVLRLIVGAGGVNAFVQGTANTGGGGHGNGGNSGPTNGTRTGEYPGGSGGGGSAILQTTTPLVIAGGGGGGGMGLLAPGTLTGTYGVAPPVGAAAGATATDGQLSWPAASRVVRAQGGRGSVAGGAGGTTANQFATSPNAGLSGGSALNGGAAALGGSAGGRGGYVGFAAGTGYSQGGVGGGGGGGGYGGGGGGAAAVVLHTTATAPQAGALATASGGGGGGSYVRPNALGTIIPVPGSSSVGVATNGGNATNVRRHGSIQLTYCPG